MLITTGTYVWLFNGPGKGNDYRTDSRTEIDNHILLAT